MDQTIFYTDEHLKWSKPPMAVCVLIDLSVTKYIDNTDLSIDFEF
jgi:hypothetical protein